MFKNGEAHYTNQFIPSPRYSIEKELGEEYFPTIGEYKGMVGLMKLTFHAQLIKEKIKDLMKVSEYQVPHFFLNDNYLISHLEYVLGSTAKYKYHDVQQEIILPP